MDAGGWGQSGKFKRKREDLSLGWEKVPAEEETQYDKSKTSISEGVGREFKKKRKLTPTFSTGACKCRKSREQHDQ